jgi:ABC-type branched-subunit amino acid transport system ATPase component
VTVILEARGVSKRFGGIHALDGCDIEVAQGTISGLIGPNGSGKTTLFNVITGYERVREGEIRLDGRAITNMTPEAVFRLGIGRTFQLTRVFGRLSVMDNMLVASQHDASWARRAFRKAGSHGERAKALELLEFVDIARLANEPAATLSYGQRKLLEFAYVLMADPEFLLLDEPAGGINPSLINTLAERIRALNKEGRTFLVVEHNMEFVMGLCHNVTVMHHGRTLVSGDPETVRRDPRVLDAYLGGVGEDEEADGADGAGAPGAPVSDES